MRVKTILRCCNNRLLCSPVTLSGMMYWMIDQMITCISEFYACTKMALIQVTHDVHFGRNFCRNLFCDARLTKDGVALIPVHKIILSSFSPKFKKIFESEDQKDGMTFVPIVDFPNLKKVVAFIYDGRITLNSKEELNYFLDALNYLKVVYSRNSVTIYLDAFRNR